VKEDRSAVVWFQILLPFDASIAKTLPSLEVTYITPLATTGEEERLSYG
jgi:hypothetical protein